MSMIQKARNLAQSFLTEDDVVLGQSLVDGGLGQVARVGFSSSGPSVAVNVASRFLCLGAQVASRAAALPLAGEAATLAGKVGSQAKELGEHCSNLAVLGIELAGGTKARNPITKQDWLNKQAAPGYTPGELTADTVFGTLQRLTMLPINVGMDTLHLSAASRTASTVRKAVTATLDKYPAGLKQLENAELYQELGVLAMESGTPFMQTSLALADAAARLAFSDTRALREELTRGVARAELLASDGQTGAGSRLRKRAKRVADHPPREFMAALERGSHGEAPTRQTILSALIKDWRALLTFSTMYPQMMGLLGNDLMAVLLGETARKTFSPTASTNERNGTSTTFTRLDALVGSAITAQDETPLFSRAAVYLAQDLSYLADRDEHGREAALERIEHLFGAKVRERIFADVSLDHDVMLTAGQPIATRIREYIRASTDHNTLSRQIDLCAERLALLESSETPARLTLTNSLMDRIQALRLFTSLAACDLAMRGTPPPDANPQAKAAFLAWAADQD